MKCDKCGTEKMKVIVHPNPSYGSWGTGLTTPVAPPGEELEICPDCDWETYQNPKKRPTQWQAANSHHSIHVHVDKRTMGIRYEEETEDFVKVVIEPKE